MLFTVLMPKKKVNMKIAVDCKNMMYLSSFSFPQFQKIFSLPSSLVALFLQAVLDIKDDDFGVDIKVM